MQGCPTRSIASRSTNQIVNMTDTQIATSALAFQVCDLFIAETVNILPPTARSTSGFVDAVRQGCISDITLTGYTEV